MAIAQNIADGLDGTLASVVPANTAAPATETALVVIHRDDDPVLAAIKNDDFIQGEGGQISIGQNLLNTVAGTGWLDVSMYRALAIQIVPVGTITAGTIVFEGSNDGNAAVAMMFVDKANMAANPVNSIALATGVNRFMLGNVFFRYFRARISVAVTGTGASVSACATGLSSELSFAIQHTRAGDGTSLQAMKVASTAPVAGDIAAVVALSPNLPAPSMSVLNSAATTNATLVKATPGSVLSLAVSNMSVSNRFVKLYNKATAPVVGTDVPVLTIFVGPASTVTLNLGILGLRFTVGIGFGITGGSADSDTTAVAASDVKLMLSYI